MFSVQPSLKEDTLDKDGIITVNNGMVAYKPGWQTNLLSMVPLWSSRLPPV